VKDAGESGYQGTNTVSYQQGGGNSTSISTDATGAYSFLSPQNTSWTVSLNVPVGYLSSNGVTSRVVSVTSSNISGIDFGIVLAPTPTPMYTISGYVFTDKNGNGTKDGSDTCFSGNVSVTCCGVTKPFTVNNCQVNTWCTCNTPTTAVTIIPPENYSAKWSGTDASGRAINGSSATANITLSSN
jgi:hypothetical protein